MDWLLYCRRLLLTALVLASVLYAFILILDPYQNVPFSPALDRAPIATNQRFSYPAIARDPAFDSVVIGTSTSRLIDPSALGAATGARFANLAMNSATAYEQRRIYDLFLRHHPSPRFLVLGVDETWCNRAAEMERYTFRDFPEWMYDASRWNDVAYLFNDKALEDAVRMAELLLGQREAKYRRDGYRDFTRDLPAWEARAVAARLHGGATDEIPPLAMAPARAHPGWTYPRLNELRALLDATATATRILLVMPPLHARYLAARAESLAECKGRLGAMASVRPNLSVLDYMAVSALTSDDRNYFDPVHFTRAVSAMVESDIGAVLRGAPPLSAYGRLMPPAE
ncbi:MAG: hypothetical protein AB7Q81_05805 [Gammaproteobacteria bacterium]